MDENNWLKYNGLTQINFMIKNEKYLKIQKTIFWNNFLIFLRVNLIFFLIFILLYNLQEQFLVPSEINIWII